MATGPHPIAYQQARGFGVGRARGGGRPLRAGRLLRALQGNSWIYDSIIDLYMINLYHILFIRKYMAWHVGGGCEEEEARLHNAERQEEPQCSPNWPCVAPHFPASLRRPEAANWQSVM